MAALGGGQLRLGVGELGLRRDQRRIQRIAEKAAAIENEIIEKFIEKIRAISTDLMNTADLIADMDVWLSLAECADLYSWVRPTITETNEFDIVGGRHPVIEYVLRHNGGNFVKND